MTLIIKYILRLIMEMNAPNNFPFFILFNCMKDTQCHGFIYYHSTSRHKHKTLTFWFFKTGGVGCVYYSLCERIISQIRWITKIFCFVLFCVRCFTSLCQIKKKENKKKIYLVICFEQDSNSIIRHAFMILLTHRCV